MSKSLLIEEDRVRRAANKYPEFTKVLHELFPEVFQFAVGTRVRTPANYEGMILIESARPKPITPGTFAVAILSGHLAGHVYVYEAKHLELVK